MHTVRSSVATTLALLLASCRPGVSPAPEAPSSSATSGDDGPAGSDEPASGDDASACPVAWMQVWAEQQGLAIDTCRRMQLDDDAALEAVARLCRDEGMSATYLLDDAAGRFSIPHDGWGHTSLCTAFEPDAAKGLVLSDTGPGDAETRVVALRDRRPVIVEQSWSSDRNPPVVIAERWDYAAGQVERSATQDECPDRASLTARGAIVTVGGPEVSAWVLDGAEHHQGPADAGLTVRATASADDVIIDVVVRDDEPMLATAAKRSKPTDVLVVHWAEASTSSSDPLGCRGTKVMELRIVAFVGGTVKATGSGADSASVTGRFDALTIRLDSKALGLGPSPWRLPLTVELDDLDADGQSRLATSEIVAGQPGSLGAVVRHEGDAAFPPIGTAVP